MGKLSAYQNPANKEEFLLNKNGVSIETTIQELGVFVQDLAGLFNGVIITREQLAQFQSNSQQARVENLEEARQEVPERKPISTRKPISIVEKEDEIEESLEVEEQTDEPEVMEEMAVEDRSEQPDPMPKPVKSKVSASEIVRQRMEEQKMPNKTASQPSVVPGMKPRQKL
jgi:archaellum component FlaD/FlaE